MNAQIPNNIDNPILFIILLHYIIYFIFIYLVIGQIFRHFLPEDELEPHVHEWIDKLSHDRYILNYQTIFHVSIVKELLSLSIRYFK
jgi:hypothetical protein